MVYEFDTGDGYYVIDEDHDRYSSRNVYLPVGETEHIPGSKVGSGRDLIVTNADSGCHLWDTDSKRSSIPRNIRDDYDYGWWVDYEPRIVDEIPEEHQ